MLASNNLMWDLSFYKLSENVTAIQMAHDLLRYSLLEVSRGVSIPLFDGQTNQVLT